MAKMRLLPHDERFFELFENATTIAAQAVQVLERMLGDFAQAETYRQQIADLEHQGDAVIHEVMDKLNRTFVTPLDPEDIRAIASRLDNIIDFTQAASERIVLYHVRSAYPDSIELVRVLGQTVTEVHKVVGLLRDFRHRRDILTHCIEINRLENAGDKLYREALGSLFRQGDVMELLRWKEIFEQIEQAVDECEDLADVIESLVVKHA